MPPDVQGFGRALLHAAQGLLGMGFGAACLVNSGQSDACPRRA